MDKGSVDRKLVTTHSRPVSAQSSDDEDPMDAARASALRRQLSNSDMVVQLSKDGNIVKMKRAFAGNGDGDGEADFGHGPPKRNTPIFSTLSARSPHFMHRIAFAVVLIAIVLGFVSIMSDLELDLGEEPKLVKDWRARGHFLDLDEDDIEANIFVVSEGPPSPRMTVLFLHDVFDTSFSFQGIADAMVAIGVRAVLFDFPGFGLSSAPVHHHHRQVIDKQAIWIGEVLSSLDIDKVAIIAQGTSLAAACVFASKYPNTVSHIISYGGSLEERVVRMNITNTSFSGLSKLHILKFLYPLSFHKECEDSDSVQDTSPSMQSLSQFYTASRDQTAANTYLSLHHGRIGFLHHLRQLLLLTFPTCNATHHAATIMPPSQPTANNAATSSSAPKGIQWLWLAQTPHTGDSIVNSRTQMTSASICLHRYRPTDFLLSVMNFIDPSITRHPGMQE